MKCVPVVFSRFKVPFECTDVRAGAGGTAFETGLCASTWSGLHLDVAVLPLTLEGQWV